ncbi:MAG: type II secretion system protein GspK [PVC group bacterium]
MAIISFPFNHIQSSVNKESEAGVVLLTVVLVIALLGVLVMQYNYLSALDVKMAAGARDNLEAYYLAQAGLNRAIYLLEEDKLEELEEAQADESAAGVQQSVSSEDEETGVDSLDEPWALAWTPQSLGSGTYYFKIVDEDRKFNLNLLLEDAVKEVAAARAFLAGGEEEKEDEKERPAEEKRKEGKEEKKEEKGKTDEEEETDEDDDEIEIDDESPEYLALALLLEKLRELADEADGIDPFARSLFDTPKGTMNAIVDWFEDEPGGDTSAIERSGPVEAFGELSLIKDMSREMLLGSPLREEIEVKKEEGELELIDPWAVKPFSGLRGYLTVYGDGKVNINTAPREVLEVMLQDEDDDQMSLAADIIAARGELPFESVEAVNDDEYLSEKIKDKFLERFKVDSEYFNILSEGRVGETTARIRAVVQRQEDRIVICYWRYEGR